MVTAVRALRIELVGTQIDPFHRGLVGEKVWRDQLYVILPNFFLDLEDIRTHHEERKLEETLGELTSGDTLLSR